MKSRFSDRIGVTRPPGSIQVNSMNESLQNSIWNLLLEVFNHASLGRLYIAVIKDFLKEPLGTPRGPIHLWFRDLYFQMQWFEVYNLLEFIAQDFLQDEKIHFMDNLSGGTGILPSASEFEQEVNEILERELSGYRFIQKQIVPISNEIETSVIKEALKQSEQAGLQGAHTHLKTALEFLSKKPNADYRNSIKEAISAVESLAKYITGVKGQGLKEPLDEFSSKIPIHGALKEAFIKLYGYSSNEQGIRHALLDAPNVGLEEAQFMLVSCSAFVSYLISKARKAKLIK